MTDIKMDRSQTSLILEAANLDDDRQDIAFRAITFEQCQDSGALSVVNILETQSIGQLREAVKMQMNPTHYQSSHGDGSSSTWKSDTPWSDALRVLKEKLHAKVVEEGTNVSKGATPINMCCVIRAAREAKVAAELHKIEQDQKKADKQYDAAHRANDRSDFDAWERTVVGMSQYGTPERCLANTIRHAKSALDGWSQELADHVDAITKNPVNALGWSGDFIEKAAAQQVASFVVDMFENGVEVDVLLDAATRKLLQRADRATSRSSSVMSNVIEDATRAAWTEVFKRLSGRSFW